MSPSLTKLGKLEIKHRECVNIIFNMKSKNNLKLPTFNIDSFLFQLFIVEEHISTEEYLVTVNGCAIFRPLQTGNKMQIFFFLSEFYLGGNIKH